MPTARTDGRAQAPALFAGTLGFCELSLTWARCSEQWPSRQCRQPLTPSALWSPHTSASGGTCFIVLPSFLLQPRCEPEVGQYQAAGGRGEETCPDSCRVQCLFPVHVPSSRRPPAHQQLSTSLPQGFLWPQEHDLPPHVGEVESAGESVPRGQPVRSGVIVDKHLVSSWAAWLPKDPLRD